MLTWPLRLLEIHVKRGYLSTQQYRELVSRSPVISMVEACIPDNPFFEADL
jgi:hypothetical protein